MLTKILRTSSIQTHKQRIEKIRQQNSIKICENLEQISAISKNVIFDNLFTNKSFKKVRSINCFCDKI